MNFRIVKNTFTVSAIGAVFLLNACRDPEKYPGYEYMPDMYVGPAVEMYAPSLDNPDSTSALRPVAGTRPRGFTFFSYPSSNEGYELAGAEVHNPLAMDSINLMEGKRLYSNYCMQCHGENGQGDGSIVANGKFPPPPSYSKGNSSRGGLMKDLTDGKIYHTITYGVNLMGPHAAQLLPEERWKIVEYIHELQKYGLDAAPVAAKDSTTANASEGASMGGKKAKL